MEENDASICNKGFHACLYPTEVFYHYEPANSRYALVTLQGLVDSGAYAGKLCGNTIFIFEELYSTQMARACEEIRSSDHRYMVSGVQEYKLGDDLSKTYAYSECFSRSVYAHGNQSVAVSDVVCSTSSAGGVGSVAIARNRDSVAVTYDSTSIAYCTKAYCVAKTKGLASVAVVEGDCSVAVSTGLISLSETFGLGSVAVAFGASSVSRTVGDYSVAVAAAEGKGSQVKGRNSMAVCTKAYGVADADGIGSVSVVTGGYGAASAGVGGAIVLVRRSTSGVVTHIKTGIVGCDGILPGVRYTLNGEGEIVQVEDENAYM